LSDTERFILLMLVSSLVFPAVIAVTTRKRTTKPNPGLLFLLTAIVVCCGMLFARYGHILFRFPWWIYYGVPALVTFILPPFALKMNRAEIAQYIPMAILMAPAIHVFVSLFIGWHDYMPFPVYIPSLLEMYHRLA
jgi:hypothetical protein